MGTHCGLEAYFIIKEHQSYLSFERRACMNIDLMGVSMGTKQHSRRYVAKFRKAAYTVLMRGQAKVMLTPGAATGCPPAFCGIADKATVGGRTGQMTGLIMMCEGQLIAVFLAVLPCPDITGKGLAESFIEVFCGGSPLTLSHSHFRGCYVGFAADGQYQGAAEGHPSGLDVHGHVPTRLSGARARGARV